MTCCFFRTLSRLRTTPVTIDTFFADLAAAARRLGYPLDADAARMLEAALHCTAEEWTDHARQDDAMIRMRKTVLRAVMLALNSGMQKVDGRTMAVAIADAENAEVVQPTQHTRLPHAAHPHQPHTHTHSHRSRNHG